VRAVAVDEEFEQLKKKRLSVLNATAEPVGQLVLEDPGLEGGAGPVDTEALRSAVLGALRTVYDPEIPLNIYDLGLIYGFDVFPEGRIDLRMTLTAPGCPVAGALVREVHEKVRSVPGVSLARTELVWDPPWTREHMSEAARLELGLL
jgi:FeS assembly SUF system protein